MSKKFAMITRAAHQQGYPLGMLPRRGSGTKAAPALANAEPTTASATP